MKSGFYSNGRNSLGLTLLLLLIPFSLSVAADKLATNNDAITLGKQLYTKGLLPSGKPLKALVQGDVELDGTLVTCVGCHKRSGLGSSESGKQVPPVTKQALYDRIPYGRSKSTIDRFMKSKTQLKYNDDSLKKLLVTGITPTGKQIDPLMPKFILSDKELDYLVAYMKTLSTELSPGVHDNSLTFATIVTDGVKQSKVDAMLNVLNQFFKSKNANTRNESGRAKKSPWHKESEYTGYRKWKLKVWHLKGAPSTWRQQLNEYYEKEPVFALISGISTQSWEPIHQFCEELEIPSLFPNTDLPHTSDTDFYSIYFYKGLTLEAQILENYLLERETSSIKNNSLLQLYQNNDWGKTPKNILDASSALQNKYRFHSVEISNPDQINFKQINVLIDQHKPTDIVLWLLPMHIKQIISQIRDHTSIENIYLPSSSLGSDYEPFSDDAIKILYPFEIPNEKHLFRMMYWVKGNKIDHTETFVLANTYFAVKMAIDAVTRIRTILNRDFLIEKIEHMVDNASTSSVYPRVTLAPNQRFASKGGYIAKYKNSKLISLSDWVTP